MSYIMESYFKWGPAELYGNWKRAFGGLSRFWKFLAYLIGSRVLIHTNHAALKHLFSKKDAKPRLIRWVLPLQEFTCKIRDRKGSENLIANHLSWIILQKESEFPILECFPD